MDIVKQNVKPYYDHGGVTLFHGDFRDLYRFTPTGDCAIADPPYDQTSLAWDKWPEGWLVGASIITRSLWVFGTMRMFMERAAQFESFKMSQDVVWEKHNGSSFHADRFRRVHEAAAHFYTGPWESIYKNVPTTPDATKKTVRRKQRPPHMGVIGDGAFESQDGGPRLMRSVIYEPSCHGYADNETQKPLGIIRPLIEYSCPPGGLVIDCFSGSGSVLVAAKEMGRRAVGFEMREEQCEIAARRLSQEVMQFGV